MACCREGPNGGCCGESWCYPPEEEDVFSSPGWPLNEGTSMTDKHTPEPCGECNGRGFIVGILPSEPPCPRCKGHGTVTDKHTPGPWRDTGLPDGYARTVVGDGPKLVCMLPRFGDNAELRATVLANARLIAAAPELLRVLEGQIVRAGESIASGAATIHETHTKECLAGRYWETNLCTQHCQPVVAAIKAAKGDA